MTAAPGWCLLVLLRALHHSGCMYVRLTSANVTHACVNECVCVSPLLPTGAITTQMTMSPKKRCLPGREARSSTNSSRHRWDPTPVPGQSWLGRLASATGALHQDLLLFPAPWHAALALTWHAATHRCLSACGPAVMAVPLAPCPLQRQQDPDAIFQQHEKTCSLDEVFANGAAGCHSTPHPLFAGDVL